MCTSPTRIMSRRRESASKRDSSLILQTENQLSMKRWLFIVLLKKILIYTFDIKLNSSTYSSIAHRATESSMDFLFIKSIAKVNYNLSSMREWIVAWKIFLGFWFCLERLCGYAKQRTWINTVSSSSHTDFCISSHVWVCVCDWLCAWLRESLHVSNCKFFACTSVYSRKDYTIFLNYIRLNTSYDSFY